MNSLQKQITIYLANYFLQKYTYKHNAIKKLNNLGIPSTIVNCITNQILLLTGPYYNNFLLRVIIFMYNIFIYICLFLFILLLLWW